MPAAAAAVATWIAAHAGAVFTMAALAAVSLVSADRMKMSSREDPGRPGQLVNTCDNRIPLPLVYGRTRLGINRVYACVTGEDNKYLHLVGNICEGPVKGIYGSVPRNHIDNGDFAQWSNGTSAAPDGWRLSGHTGGAIAREETIKKIGAYSAKLTSTTVAGQYNYLWRDVHDSFGIAYWRGRTITVGAWLWCDTASALRICVSDGVWSGGTYHPGDGQWHWVTVTHTIKADASIVRPYALIHSGSGVARVGYVDCITLVEGSYCPAFDPDGQRVNALIYKNGVLVTYGTIDYQGAQGISSSSASDLIYMNGTTDYLELFAYSSHSSTLYLNVGQPYQNYISIVGPF